MAHIVESRFQLKSEYEITCNFDIIQKASQSNTIKSILFVFNQCNNIEVLTQKFYFETVYNGSCLFAEYVICLILHNGEFTQLDYL